MQAQMTQVNRLSLPVWFGWRVSSGEISRSEETYGIYECDRSLTPTFELVRQRVRLEEIDLFNRTAHRAMEEAQEAQNFGFCRRLMMPDGTVKHVQVLAHAVTDEYGELAECIGAVLDVTGTDSSQRALERRFEDLQV
jgi:hypothetical protein